MPYDKFIYWEEELGREYNDIVGKKCANIGELAKMGFHVPPGFVLSLKAYEKFMTDTGATKEIRQYLATFSADPRVPADMPKYAEASKMLRCIVESKTMPKDMEAIITSYYEELRERTRISDVPVATRSSGPASHPGQYETHLHVRGKLNVIENIIKVWSSTFNQRSLIARARQGSPLESDPIGVCVLQMVNAKAAGVMFTLNPMNGDPSKIVMEGNWGLGESVVSGRVSPDKWMVDKVVFEIVETTISPKLEQYVVDPKIDEALWIDVPPEKQNAPCLSEQKVLELAKIGKKIEGHFGVAQDIEWAIDNSLPFLQNVFVLQCRPEQIWSKEKVEPKLKTAGSLVGDIASLLKNMKA